MVDLKKILRQAFGKSTLENEDWLEPSDDLLERIEARIYPQKSGRTWLFLLPILLLILVFGGIWLGNRGSSNLKAYTPIISAQIMEGVVGENATGASTQKSMVQADQTQHTPQILAVAKGTAKTPIISDKNNLLKTSENSAIPTALGFNKFVFTNEIIPKTSTLDKSFSQSRTITENPISIASDKSIPNLIESDLTVKSLDPLTNLLTSPALFPVAAAVDVREAPPIRINLNKESPWSIVAGGGVSHWQFKLNDAYRTLLAPADFQSTNGIGFRTFVGLDRKMNSRFSLGMSLAYDQVKFNSGHNSVLTYDRTAETDNDPSNAKIVTMATPVGFVESDLVIHRNNDVPDAEVLIDIKNQHRIQSLDLQLNLDYKMRDVYGLTPVIRVGAGVQYVVNLTNELASFTPEQMDFSAGKGDIISEQSSLQKWSPTVTTGFSLEKKFSGNISVGINGSYLFNLNELQKMNTFSTRVRRFNGGIYLRRSF